MKKLVNITDNTHTRVTISPSESEIRIKLCKSDVENKDILLEAIHKAISDHPLPTTTVRLKISKRNDSYMFVYKKMYTIPINDLG